MAILAFDTTLDVCSVALLDAAGNDVLAERHNPMSRGHAETLHGLIGEVLEEAGLKLSDISRIAVTTGPGTFTGSRIGVAAARGFALVLDVDVVGISTLQALACNVKDAEMPIMAVLDAKREQVYAAVYDATIAVVKPPQAVNLEDIAAISPSEPFMVIGSGSALVCDIVPHAKRFIGEDLPRASYWGSLAVNMPTPETLPLPLYLRPPDAKPPAANAVVKRATQ